MFYSVHLLHLWILAMMSRFSPALATVDTGTQLVGHNTCKVGEHKVGKDREAIWSLLHPLIHEGPWRVK